MRTNPPSLQLTAVNANPAVSAALNEAGMPDFRLQDIPSSVPAGPRGMQPASGWCCVRGTPAIDTARSAVRRKGPSSSVENNFNVY